MIDIFSQVPVMGELRKKTGYAAVYKQHRTATTGGLHKEDIMRRCVRSGARSEQKYRYVSRARHDAAMARMHREGGLPPGFSEYKIRKKFRRCPTSRRKH